MPAPKRKRGRGRPTLYEQHGDDPRGGPTPEELASVHIVRRPPGMSREAWLKQRNKERGEGEYIGRGRPRVDAQERVHSTTVSLSNACIAMAQDLGGGNLSKGVRLAVRFMFENRHQLNTPIDVDQRLAKIEKLIATLNDKHLADLTKTKKRIRAEK